MSLPSTLAELPRSLESGLAGGMDPGGSAPQAPEQAVQPFEAFLGHGERVLIAVLEYFEGNRPLINSGQRTKDALVGQHSVSHIDTVLVFEQLAGQGGNIIDMDKADFAGV